MTLHTVDVIIRSLEENQFCINKMTFFILLPSQIAFSKNTKIFILLMQINFLLMIELWHPRYVESSKTSKEHVYVHFSHFGSSSAILWPIMYDIEKSWKMWFWPKIIIFFQGSKWAENVKYCSKMALWASKNHFLQNFDARTYFYSILGKSNFWRFSIFLKCGFGTFWAENTVLGAKKHKKLENHIFWYFTFFQLKMARLIRPQSSDSADFSENTHFPKNP